tara:strand:+ start:439 stop:588 length:150 start_codon:yes stop_codon:yes gene_type:complete
MGKEYSFSFSTQAVRAHTFFFDKKVCKKSSQSDPCLLIVGETVARLTAD